MLFNCEHSHCSLELIILAIDVTSKMYVLEMGNNVFANW